MLKLNLLNKIARKAVVAAASPFIDQEAIIEQIHKEFDNASDEALKEAERVIGEVDKNMDTKGKRLSDLGFLNCEAAKRFNVGRDIADKKRKEMESILYFKQNYPNYKFIIHEQVSAICSKYGLLCGDVYSYKGEVPEKNISEIEAFKIKEEDDFGYAYSSVNNFSKEMSHKEYLIEKTKWGYTNFHPYRLSICAPASQMEVRDSEEVKMGFIVAKDPIVLKRVEGGFLIVSKWGLEANDKELVNEKMN